VRRSVAAYGMNAGGCHEDDDDCRRGGAAEAAGDPVLGVDAADVEQHEEEEEEDVSADEVVPADGLRLLLLLPLRAIRSPKKSQ